MGTGGIVTKAVPTFVRKNHSSFMPSRWVFLDTEANRVVQKWGERQSFRLAVLRFERKRSDKAGWTGTRYETIRDTRTLWERVDAFTHAKSRTVVVAHNLGYDLLIANTFAELPSLGWHIVSCNIESNRAWMVWDKDNRTLVLTDMLSWIGKPLAEIAKYLGMTKPDLPAWDDTDEAWEARCKADVAIMGDAWLRMMDWVVENECGMWRPTGAGQSWSAFRHKFHTTGIVHHGRDELYEMERRACWTGRCEAWVHGKLEGGPFTEWDMTLAYATIARDCALPIAPLGRSFNPSLSSLLSISRQHSVIAECLIRTSEPVVPAEKDDRIVWPIGSFRTTLWDNEIKVAIEHGASVQIEHMEVYRKAPILQAWGDWIIALLDAETGVQDQIIRTMLKGWARTVVGRFGLRYSTWEHWGQVPFPQIMAFTLFDGTSVKGRRCVAIGNDSLVEAGETEAPDSVPSVMGYIMAECRARLWRLLHYVGSGNVLYCDTDSLWTGPLSGKQAAWLYKQGCRPKQTWTDVTILGPRQLILSGEIKASGVPYKARISQGKVWKAESFSSPMQQLRHGMANAVDINIRRGRLSAPDLRRIHLPDGSTTPYIMELSEEVSNIA